MSRRSKVLTFPSDPLKSAEAAGLRYVRDDAKGIRRLKSGTGFRYVSPEGRTITDEETLKRIRSLVIPPAWTDVWICPSPYGHIQAVGRDAKGRKQYRYHSAYRHIRDQTKYGRMLAFGAALPALRERVEEDLKLPGLPRNKVLAAVTKVLESTCMRIGNDEYKAQNDSYGLTTLQDKHVKVEGSKMRFRFRGKSGQQQDIELEDPKLAKIVKRVRDIPGYELFQYYDDAGNVCDVTSSDVNDYIREITGGQDFTAKDFRTWGGTGFAALALEALGRADTPGDVKKKVVDAIKQVSQKLGNRPATCRKYYVHPAILDAYSDGTLFDALTKCDSDKRQEACVMSVVSDYVKKLAEDKKMSQDFSEKLRESIRRGA
ncbi:MAG TPA: DNA topoisomerase IB [Bryobacteraceae bacterium]|nr:DNA topoisomerase IB [Bryobacteraceae bacterium]